MEQLPPSPEWNVFGKKIPKAEVVYISQILLIYIVSLACIINLSIGIEHRDFWIALLSSSIGYILPNPTLKTRGHDVRRTIS